MSRGFLWLFLGFTCVLYHKILLAQSNDFVSQHSWTVSTKEPGRSLLHTPTLNAYWSFLLSNPYLIGNGKPLWKQGVQLLTLQIGWISTRWKFELGPSLYLGNSFGVDRMFRPFQYNSEISSWLYAVELSGGPYFEVTDFFSIIPKVGYQYVYLIQHQSGTNLDSMEVTHGNIVWAIYSRWKVTTSWNVVLGFGQNNLLTHAWFLGGRYQW
ncbi:MAG: hypothetical protein NZ480_07660 [Bdellovibrionaceae bacterium]|nr:hypothetical protein [Pseudobdellovibrionaceae bacterium]MDW8191074.1 hypothetical protein [Pseudobdellovibrionaceae bacterium]